VTLSSLFAIPASISFALLIWQWIAALRFPLHRRIASPSPQPPVTLLKPLKNLDSETESCLRSWLAQDYSGPVQVLFGVGSEKDPVCATVNRLIEEFPALDLQLVICAELKGANAKVSKLAILEKFARHEWVVMSDADVRVPSDFLTNVLAPLHRPETGLVSCFYRLANPSSAAMQWEAIAVNSDFWSQVLQAKSLKPVDFALGAVMAMRRKQLREIGGLESIADCLADDYQLGNRIARLGHRIELCPVVAECWDPPMTWISVWKHQLRWARTIRVCQPLPYFFSLLSNLGFWSLLWLAALLSTSSIQAMKDPNHLTSRLSISVDADLIVPLIFLVIRTLVAFDLQHRLTRRLAHVAWIWLVPIKDLLQAVIWLCAFAGNRIEWRGKVFQLRRDGTLQKL
jgi:ceramide glucosyltransferase